MPLPADLAAQEQAAHTELLETLADFDDHLLEELLDDIEPPQVEVLQDLKTELGSDLIVPVFVGVAAAGFWGPTAARCFSEGSPRRKRDC